MKKLMPGSGFQPGTGYCGHNAVGGWKGAEVIYTSFTTCTMALSGEITYTLAVGVEQESFAKQNTW